MANERGFEDEITRLVRQEVGDADPAVVSAIVGEVVKAIGRRRADGGGAPAAPPSVPSYLDCVRCKVGERPELQNRGVVTVTGMNRSGIVAGFASLVAEFDADILDISQTIVGGFFTMIMILDLNGLAARGRTFSELKRRLLALGNRLGVQVVAVHEEIFRGMQRI